MNIIKLLFDRFVVVDLVIADVIWWTDPAKPAVQSKKAGPPKSACLHCPSHCIVQYDIFKQPDTA